MLYLISAISENHCRCKDFFCKIERIIQYLKDSITKNFTNFEIFKIFKGSFIIILFFIEEKMLIIDESVYSLITCDIKMKEKYQKFFQPEIEQFLTEKSKNSKSKSSQKESTEELPEDFYEKRKLGENDDYICQLIREDKIEEFIIFVQKNDYSLNQEIKSSIYETNSLINKISHTLIEYAAFFGSIQIFKYLYLNKAALNPPIWYFAIHGDNPEIFQILNEKKIIPCDSTYEDCLKEAIKCHHNDIANYIQNNFLDTKIESQNIKNNIKENILSYCFHYHNYLYFPDELDNQFIFTYACKYDYYKIVEYFLKNKKVDLNEISIQFFF